MYKLPSDFEKCECPTVHGQYSSTTSPHLPEARSIYPMTDLVRLDCLCSLSLVCTYSFASRMWDHHWMKTEITLKAVVIFNWLIPPSFHLLLITWLQIGFINWISIAHHAFIWLLFYIGGNVLYISQTFIRIWTWELGFHYRPCFNQYRGEKANLL